MDRPAATQRLLRFELDEGKTEWSATLWGAQIQQALVREVEIETKEEAELQGVRGNRRECN